MVDNEKRLAFLDGILDSQINMVTIMRKISRQVVQNENTTDGIPVNGMQCPAAVSLILKLKLFLF